MKSTVEKLSPTRVRINVEVPFAELKPDFERAYQQLAKQVRVPGFRPGRAPAKILEARVGRGAVLQQVVNDVLPGRYSEAVTTTDVRPLGKPEIEVTKIEDGEELIFTAEVDVRPDIKLPNLNALQISVDAVAVTDEDVDAELDTLRARFGTLVGVERAAQDGDFVSIDLSATVDGVDIPDAKTEGLSHEVGSDKLIEGLDDAIVGLSEGESKVFTTRLVAGEYSGQDAEVNVTVKSIKERELPAADDDFAQLASEFDTIEELRTNLQDQVLRVKRIHQAEAIRDTALETLLEQVEVPLPETIVQAHIEEVTHGAVHSLDHDEAKFAEELEAQGSSREKFDAETRDAAEKSVKTQLLMDAIADDLEIQPGQNDLTERLVLMARQYGIEPQQLAGILQQNNQLQAVYADVRRGLTVAAVVEKATVTDSDGNVVDTTEFFGSPESAEAGAEGATDAVVQEAVEAPKVEVEAPKVEVEVETPELEKAPAVAKAPAAKKGAAPKKAAAAKKAPAADDAE